MAITNLENSRLNPEAQGRLKKMIEDKERKNVLLRLSTGQSANYDHAEQNVPNNPRAWTTASDQYDALRNQVKPGQGAGRKPVPDLAKVLGQTNSYKPSAR